MNLHMKQILIEIEPEVAEQLEAVAPARSRRRSEFIRNAIRKALWEIEEQRTAQAYRQLPDVDEPVYFDPQAWEPATRVPRRKRSK
jgi:predicted transcriptional regulator